MCEQTILFRDISQCRMRARLFVCLFHSKKCLARLLIICSVQNAMRLCSQFQAGKFVGIFMCVHHFKVLLLHHLCHLILCVLVRRFFFVIAAAFVDIVVV